ncbi:fimbrial protein [Rhodanobacter sp. AS-Z3]|uniref:fimbrial protein n=1 Tax=Rhodanobacter sp. AS-Z3 TaxID=3031330 RepID=UPI00247A2673|nr:fimbrial protein [Rhodanobacter sp. AS-Z3]WEN15215.1 fimbrial protein [Rhodanobacter sp. AS-Z3]
MNKSLLATALVAVIAATAFAPSAHAANSGTINFSGKVLADTCVVNVNGNTTSTVTLPTVMTGAFTGAGTVAGTTPFTIALTGCDNNATAANMAFTAGTNVDSTTGNLKNATSGGANVQIQLLNSSNAAINTSTNTNAPTISISGGAGSTALKAQYIATAAATSAGLVTSSVGFTLTYL